jgi:hypothetical protein
MANAPKSDADCIEAAYEDAVTALYKQFFTNLTGQPKNEKELLANFTTGVQLAKRAKTLALGIVQVSEPAVAVADKVTQRPRRKPARR